MDYSRIRFEFSNDLKFEPHMFNPIDKIDNPKSRFILSKKREIAVVYVYLPKY